MQTPEDRFFGSLRGLVGSVSFTELEKEAEETQEQETETETEVETPAKTESITKLADMSIHAIMSDQNFLKGVSDRIAQRCYEIENSIQHYVME